MALNLAPFGRWTLRDKAAQRPLPSTLERNMSRNQLIVQLPVTESSDFDSLIQVEETLIQAFSQNRFAEVDGHDIGEGKFNIFIFPTGSWGPVIERVQAFLKLRGVLDKALIVKRLKASEKFVVVWPIGFAGEFQL
ncbi:MULTISPECIES: hypothetical protein [Azospira]|uniref:Uncharacterized protein n=1 Tax=Azospira oryzae (strain ATCC BAA-33 / DSM 13638 / PS) TaxID=640081 RepID=G8QJJ6_AZOOP|nr:MULTISPECIES: hypothetical protein [Azospira]AEV25421.1 hypothetical protein Dsui_1017 [Azospira oryzae PS]MDK9690985.1 hypothetical protein [Azospira sp.]